MNGCVLSAAVATAALLLPVDATMAYVKVNEAQPRKKGATSSQGQLNLFYFLLLLLPYALLPLVGSMTSVINGYEKLKLVGSGSFGKAWLVKTHDTGAHYVMKDIQVQLMDAEARKGAINEVRVLKRLKHPYIIRYRDAFCKHGVLHICMEFAAGGDLLSRIQRQKKQGHLFSEPKVLDYFIQLTLALAYLHRQNILHRDLKSQNVFLSARDHIKLGDFGISRILTNTQQHASTFVGTPYYLSPEMCMAVPYNQKSDVWALGCILYELLSLQHAFRANTISGLMVKIMAGRYPEPSHLTYSKSIRMLLRHLLDIDPSYRWSTATILHQHFLQPHIIKYAKEPDFDFLPNGKRIRQATSGAKAGAVKTPPREKDPVIMLSARQHNQLKQPSPPQPQETQLTAIKEQKEQHRLLIKDTVAEEEQRKDCKTAKNSVASSDCGSNDTVSGSETFIERRECVAQPPLPWAGRFASDSKPPRSSTKVTLNTTATTESSESGTSLFSSSSSSSSSSTSDDTCQGTPSPESSIKKTNSSSACCDFDPNQCFNSGIINQATAEVATNSPLQPAPAERESPANVVDSVCTKEEEELEVEGAESKNNSTPLVQTRLRVLQFLQPIAPDAPGTRASSETGAKTEGSVLEPSISHEVPRGESLSSTTEVPQAAPCLGQAVANSVHPKPSAFERLEALRSFLEDSLGEEKLALLREYIATVLKGLFTASPPPMTAKQSASGEDGFFIEDGARSAGKSTPDRVPPADAILPQQDEELDDIFNPDLLPGAAEPALREALRDPLAIPHFPLILHLVHCEAQLFRGS